MIVSASRLSISALFLLSVPVVTSAAVTFTITNQTKQMPWVVFSGASTLLGTLPPGSKPNQQLVANTSYCLIGARQQPPKGCQYSIPATGTSPNQWTIQNFQMGGTAGGRLWVSLAKPLQASFGAGAQPSMHDFSVVNNPDFLTRFQYVEPNITSGGGDNTIDMSLETGYSIPLSIEAYNSQDEANTRVTLNGPNGMSLIQALAPLAAGQDDGTAKCPVNANNPASCKSGGALPGPASSSPYLLINQNSQGQSNSPSYKYSPYNARSTATPQTYNLVNLAAQGFKSFVRIAGNEDGISPRATDPVVLANQKVPDAMLWPTLASYVKSLANSGATALLKDYFVGQTPVVTGPSDPFDWAAGNFNVTATFFKQTVTWTAGNCTFQGYLQLNGAMTPNQPISGVATRNLVVYVPYQFSPQSSGGCTGLATPLLSYPGTYAGGPSAVYAFYDEGDSTPLITDPSVAAWPSSNDLIAKLIGDVVSGLNFGVINSQQTLTFDLSIPCSTAGYSVPLKQGDAIGTLPSCAWWNLGAALSLGNESPWDFYFNFLQPDKGPNTASYYNIYAKAIYSLTDAYGYAYGDRVVDGQVAINWSDVNNSYAIDTVNLNILNEQPSTNKGNPAVNGISQYVVNISNSGSGNVRGGVSPNAIDCGPYFGASSATAGATCTAFLPAANGITLTANPNPGYQFTNWGGDCAKAGTQATCSLTYQKRPGNSAVGFNVYANFTPSTDEAPVALNVTTSGPGYGKVTSSPAGIDCGPVGEVCSANFPSGQQIVLTATPLGANAHFGGWGNLACQETTPGDTCTFTLSAPTWVYPGFIDASGAFNVTGSFSLNTQTSAANSFIFSLSGSPPPSPIAGSPGFSCSSGAATGACSSWFTNTTPVTLQLAPWTPSTPNQGFVVTDISASGCTPAQTGTSWTCTGDGSTNVNVSASLLPVADVTTLQITTDSHTTSVTWSTEPKPTTAFQSCGASLVCPLYYPAAKGDVSVTLTLSPNSGYTPLYWQVTDPVNGSSNQCAGLSTCDLTLSLGKLTQVQPVTTVSTPP